jgi:RNA polymerase sigma factor (sigma-70 family)
MYEEDEMLTRYLQDISQYPRIEPVREKELSDIIQNSDDPKKVKLAKEEMTLANLRLVVKYAMDYYPKFRRLPEFNLSLMDIINEGNIGLMRAVDLFDGERGVNFSTYAYWSIERRIKKAIKYVKFVRIPIHHFKHISELKSLEDEYEEIKKPLTDEIIKERLGITSEMLELIRKNRGPKISIESLEETTSASWVDDSIPADILASEKELKDYLYNKIKELNPMHRDVLFMKFFANKEMTLEDIGKRKGISRERVRQVTLEGLKILRKKIEEEFTINSHKRGNQDIPVWELIKKKKHKKGRGKL